MKQRMHAANLVGMAQDILREHPLPDDSKNYSYQQRMALKALSIAEWDREHGVADMVDEIGLFTALYGEEIAKRDNTDDYVQVVSLNYLLAGDICVGIWDDAPKALLDLLMAQTRARLRRVNPKYLKAREGGRV